MYFIIIFRSLHLSSHANHFIKIVKKIDYKILNVCEFFMSFANVRSKLFIIIDVGNSKCVSFKGFKIIQCFQFYCTRFKKFICNIVWNLNQYQFFRSKVDRKILNCFVPNTMHIRLHDVRDPSPIVHCLFDFQSARNRLKLVHPYP